MFRKRHPPAGARPGTLVIKKDSPPPRIHVIQYTKDGLSEEDVTDLNRLGEYLTGDGISWIDVHGWGDEAILNRIGEIFSLHALVMEDVVNVPQRPKTETLDDHQFFITRMVKLLDDQTVESEQVSVLIGRNHVITFQETYGDVFDPVRARIRQGGGLMRKYGADYLGYAIIDAVIDGYYPVVHHLGDTLEALEDEVLESPSPDILRRIQGVRRDLMDLRRAIWPQREAIGLVIRDDTPMISDAVCVYLRDCYDHCVQLGDVLETYREMIAALKDLYLSSLSNRMNEVMKVLTVMASIFIPLTFLAGIYGMNFEHMPELHWRWSYPMLLAVMVVMAVGMLWFFRRCGWIGGSYGEDDSDEH